MVASTNATVAKFGAQNVRTAYSSQITAPFQTPWQPVIAGTFNVQLSGTASAATVTLLRSDVDPAGPMYFTNAVIVQTISYTVGATIPITIYEPGQGWWAINVTAVTGSLNASISGVTGGTT